MASGEQQWNGFNDFCHLYKLPKNVLGAFGLTAFAVLRLYFSPSRLAAQHGAAQTDCIQLGIYLIYFFIQPLILVKL